MPPTTTQNASELDGLTKLTAAAKQLSMSVTRLRELIDAGHIAAVRDGGRIKIRNSELQRFIDSIPSYEPPVSA